MLNHTPESDATAILLDDFSHTHRENRANQQDEQRVYTAKDLKEWIGIKTLNREVTCAETAKNLRHRLRDKCSCSVQCLASNVTRKLPIISQIRNYKLRKHILSDVVAGLTIGIMHIPQGMGFALLAGLPPVYGLYTSFFPVIAYFFFTSSQSTSFGSQSLVCLMLGPLLERECRLAGFCSASLEEAEGITTTTTVSVTSQAIGRTIETSQISDLYATSESGYEILNGSIASSLDPTEAVTMISKAMDFKIGLAILFAFLVGLIQVILSVFQLGFISIYFSETFISACNLGGAFQIIATQIKFLVGLELPPVEGSFKLIKSWVAVFRHIKDINVADLIMSVISLIILIAVKKLINENPKIKPKLKIPIPIEILVVILATAITKFAKLDSRFDVSVVGVIPQGIPVPSLPPVHHFKGQYLMDSFPVALIGFLSSVLMAKLFASKYDYHVDINQELFANGVANLLSSFFWCFPSSVAPPRTMLFDSVGGKSQLAFVFSSVLILLVLLVIGQLFQTLPTAVLASVIVVALLPLIERIVDGKYYWRVNKYDFVVWIGTVSAVIVLDLGIGIVIGVLLSILSLVLHTQKPKFHTAELLKGPNIYVNTEALHSLKPSTHTTASLTEIPDNVTVFKYECPLYYANADIFSEKILDLLSNCQCLESTSREKSQVFGSDKSLKESCLSRDTPLQDGLKVSVENSADKQSTRDKSHSGRVLILDFSSVHYMDVVGLKALRLLHKKLAAQSIRLLLACCNLEVLKTMERFGLLVIIGDNNIYFSVHDAVRKSQSLAKV